MKLQTELSLSSKLFFLVLGVQYDDIGPLAVADTRGGEGEGGGGNHLQYSQYAFE